MKLCYPIGFLLLTWGIIAPVAFAQTEEIHEIDNNQEIDDTQEIDETVYTNLAWLDKTQGYASNSVNSIANQLDSFFGVPRTDIESAYSSFRVTLINSWSEFDDVDTRLRVRGKIHLPRVNERISLVFSENTEDELTNRDLNEVLGEQNQNTNVDLGFNVRTDDTRRIDFRLGLSSKFKARTSLRYRYERPFAENYLHRLSQTASFKDGDGFGSLTRYQLDKSITDNSMIRWTNDLRYEESFDGYEWETGISYVKRQTNETGMTYYYRMSGESKPSFRSGEDVGVLIRKNISRPWLFLEVETGYSWQKEGVNFEEEESPFIYLRLEMAIGSYRR